MGDFRGYCQRQGKVESRAFSLNGFDPQPASVDFNDAAADGETDSGAWNVAAVETLEGQENQLVIGRVDSLAIIANADARLFAGFPAWAPISILRSCPDLRYLIAFTIRSLNTSPSCTGIADNQRQRRHGDGGSGLLGDPVATLRNHVAQDGLQIHF